MPERSDKYDDLIPHHRRDKPLTDVEKAFEEYMELAGHNTSIKAAYISGWNQHKYLSKKLYTIEEVKDIIN